MLNRLKAIDGFSKNIILVFSGSMLLNIFNLLYQLLIAHRLAPSDFAGVNAFLSLFLIISMSQGAIQTSLAKYTAEFNAKGLHNKINFLFTSLLKKAAIFSLLTVIVFFAVSAYTAKLLKVNSPVSGYILAVLIALSWVTPVFLGVLQGLELFGWLTSVQVISGILKLASAFVFILLGFNISGALGAILVSSLTILIICHIPLKRFIAFEADNDSFNFKEFLNFIIPVAIGTFCFFTLVSSDLILVRVLFSPEDAGIYSIGQMVGKIFLFLPWAISIVMLPKTSSMNAQKLDTTTVLLRSILYAAGLCVIAGLGYNIFPSFALKVLTGKVLSESIFLGRLFGISMSFFMLLYILISYFLSIKELRFIKYLVFFTVLQILTISLFHKTLVQVQLILCINAILLFFIHLGLVNFKKAEFA